MTRVAIVFLVLLVVACSKKEKGATLKPNIVLIMADDLGYGDISCYGNTIIQTPNLDRLAAEGVRLTDFHSNGSVCSPTRAALMTGKYQQRTGVGGVITARSHREVGLSLDEITIAEELKIAGYQCGMFGKWHLGYSEEYNPTLQGFDEFVGFVSGNVDYHGHIDQEGHLDWWKGDRIINEEGYSTDLISQYASAFIKQNNPDETGKPFFLYVPHEAPHSPYQGRADKSLRQVGRAGTDSVSTDSISALYREMVETMDEGIGVIMQTLKEMGQEKNTLVIFLSDNGANKNGSNGGLRGYKAGVYEGGSRVPAICWYPQEIEGGKENDETVLTMDLLPSILDFIGEKPSADIIDGISIKKLLTDQSKLPERDVFFSYGSKSFIRSGDWKLVKISSREGDKVELYDLSRDLEEAQDLSEDRKDLLEELTQKLTGWEKDVTRGVVMVSG